MEKSNYKVWDIKPYTDKEFHNLSNFEQLQYLCHLGHLAPSTHNTQPWRFFIEPEKKELFLYLDRKFVLPESDVSARQAIISMGCCLENIKIAIEYYGYKYKITIYENDFKSILPLEKKTSLEHFVKIAKISINGNEKSSTDARGLFHSIFSRKISRCEFDPQKKISQKVLSDLENFCDGKEVIMNLVTDPVRRMAISEFQHQADNYVINTPKFAKELGEWLLPNDTDSYLGMPGIGFGLQSTQAKRLHNGLIGVSSLEPEDGLKFSQAGKTYMEKSPALVLVTVKKDSPEYWMKTGEAIEKMFLYLESCGVSVAMHAAIVEVALINRFFSATIGTTKKLTALFRIGYLKNTEDSKRPHSPRMPINEIILKKQP